MSETVTRVRLEQRRDYQFDVSFGAGVPVLVADEPPPLGAGSGPSPIQLLAAAIGNCLADSLLFALRKYRNAPEPITCDVSATTGRNAQGRLRVVAIDAALTLGVPAEALAHLDRVLGSFQDFCTVTGSLGDAIPVKVSVQDATGRRLS